MDQKQLVLDLIAEMRKSFPTREEWIIERQENFSFRQQTEANFKEIGIKLDELKSSANALDKLLEQHPIERIHHLEKHTKIPPFVLTVKE